MGFTKTEQFTGVLHSGKHMGFKQLRGESDFAETNDRTSNHCAGHNFSRKHFAMVAYSAASPCVQHD